MSILYNNLAGSSSLLTNLVVGGGIVTFLVWKWRSFRWLLGRRGRRITCDTGSCKSCSCKSSQDIFNQVLLVYSTCSGNSRRLAQSLHDDIKTRGLETSLVNARDFDPDDNVATNEKVIVIFVVSSYQDGTTSEDGRWLFKWMEETASDFRVNKTLLSNLHYTVYGVGDSNYGDNFCLAAKNLDHWLSSLSAKKFFATGFGDESISTSLDDQFQEWSNKMLRHIVGQGDEIDEGVVLKAPSDDPSASDGAEEDSEDEADEGKDEVVDIEDVVKSSGCDSKSSQREPAEMITPRLRAELTKQGYRLIGSHSGVKMCRWTKAMMRGRGGCYKHTFYGIASHQCMEATPSLACANKCVFCWRHHTNPVGTEWRWKMDEPELIVENAIQSHVRMVKEFRGVDGVLPERFEEAMNPRHCALSLVGEPIMYPKINQLIRLLHSRKISTFLVTNAQFPEAIENLLPVTQLYVSIDASNKESLKKIDRPLFRDFWQRFLDSLSALSKKGQRTVYRLTLVKEWNVEEMEGYARLVSIGSPDFIEVKGVTYCGVNKKGQSNLTMQNVPWHQEVLHFTQKLADLLPGYEVASEHEHSNCVLIANTKFKNGDCWNTWIDYDKFHDLLARYEASEGREIFTSTDYMAPLPDWATFGSNERGFDPDEKRHYRNKINKKTAS